MNTILALDLGSHSVKTALFSLENRKTTSPELLGAGKSKTHEGAMKNGLIKNLNSVISATESAIATAENSASKKLKKSISASKTILSFSNQTVKENLSSASYTRDDPSSPISASEIEDILKAVQEKATAAAKTLIALETNNPSIEMKLLSSAIVDLKIDGVAVSEPLGLPGKNLNLKVYTTLAPLLQISALEKLCDSLNLDLLAIIPEPFALARAALKTDSNFSGIILNIGAEKTNLAILENGVLAGTNIFPIGLKTASETPDAWLSALKITLNDLGLPNLPEKIYLTGGGASSEKLQETLALSNWFRTLDFTTRPTLDLLDFYLKTPPEISPLLSGLLEISLDF